MVTEQRFDLLKRVTATHYPSDPSLDASFRYDEPDAITGCTGSFPTGHPTQVLDASGSTTYCYDARGNVTAVHRVIAGHVYDTAYAWTPGDRLAALTYPSGTRVSYRYDAAGRAVAVDSQGPADAAPTPLVSAVDYLPFGPISRMTYGTGNLVMSRSYDGNYRGTSIEGLGLHLRFQRDANGNIIGLREGQGPGPLTERYRYDALQRLTQTIGPHGWDNKKYSYNATGDRLTKHEAGGPPVSYSYQPGTHRLSAIDRPGQGDEHGHCDHGNHGCKGDDGAVLSDAAGNIVQMPQDGQLLTLTYGANNRLMQTSTSQGAQGRYIYNASGLRAEKTSNVPDETRDFIYDGAHLLGEYVVGAVNTHEYVWLGERVIASLDSSALGPSVHYIGTDFLGTPRSVTNLQGTPVWSWSYAGNAFGEGASTGTYNFSLPFTGQYYDVESGINYNSRRDYNPGSGRYVESDPFGLRSGINTYLYVGGNPLAYLDPGGLQQISGPRAPSSRSWERPPGVGGSYPRSSPPGGSGPQNPDLEQTPGAWGLPDPGNVLRCISGYCTSKLCEVGQSSTWPLQFIGRPPSMYPTADQLPSECVCTQWVPSETIQTLPPTDPSAYLAGCCRGWVSDDAKRQRFEKTIRGNLGGMN